MRNLIFYGAITLDGFLATEHDDLSWLFATNVGETTSYEQFLQGIETTVMGKTTYDFVKKELKDEPLYPGKTNLVFTHQPVHLEDAQVVRGDVATVLRGLKAQPGQDIWLVGGGSIILPALEADLIDEYYVQIAPVLLGRGKRLFLPGNYQKRLELVGVTHFGELSELHFKRK